jgi:MSHA biogenesis protein MshQ
MKKYSRSLIIVLTVAAVLVLSIPAQAAISWVATGTAASSTGSNSRDLVVPTIIDNDVLIAHIAIRGSRTITPPSGWTLIDQVYVSANSRMTQGIYFKLGLASDSGTTVRWNFDASDDNAGVICAYRGVDTATPIGNFSEATGNSATMTASSITTTVANEWLVTFYGAASDAASPVTTPGGMVEQYDFSNGGGGNGLSLAGDDEARPTAGVSGSRVSTSSSSSRYVAQLIALKPIVAPTTITAIDRLNTDPTSAAAVSWTVTFSGSVTGVSAAAFTLAASGMSGAFITSVTGSGTTWTIMANTGIGSGTLGLNQTGAGSVTPTLTGTFTGQFYTITSTPALAEYRMDEASWNGTANEVLDSSGNGNNAQSFNIANTTDGSRAIAGSPGTCRYGVFDNGGTITKGYVQTPLPNLTTDFTVTSWIKTTNNTVSGQRILIDDQGSGAGTGYGFSLADGATGILRFYSRGVTPVILDSTYTIANNTWYFVAAVADIINKKRTIYVFNQSGVLLNSTTEAAWTGTWGTDSGPVSIGAETNASAEVPASFHFYGNLDEVRVYQKVLSQNALAAIATQSHACAGAAPHHLEIQHASGTGLTCAASTLTIRACADAACSTLYTGAVSGTLSATGTPAVNWSGGSGAFTIAAGSGSVTKDVQVAAAGSVVFGISSPAPVPSNATTCNFGSPVCTFTANTAGFVFSNTTTGSSYTIPAQVSGIATPTLYLRAVQASTTNAAVCTPAIVSSTTSVSMGYACNNPAICQAGSLATITNTTTSTATAIAPGGASVTLNFDANGAAPITARYDDVGTITLSATKAVIPFGGATATTLNGNSNTYVVAPHHFGFSAISAGPIKAGNNFSATVTAYNGLATPAVTANFGKETAAESVTATFSKCMPSGSNAVNGTFSGSVGSFNNGTAIASNLNWSEVGNGDLVATLASGSYLSSGLTATGNSGTGGTACNGGGAGNVGAFIPDHLITTVNDGCTGCGFTYSGQPFTVVVTAKNGLATPGTTVNYDGTANTSPNFSNNVSLTDATAATPAPVGKFGISAAPMNVTVNVAADTLTVPKADFVSGAATLTTVPVYAFNVSPTVPTLIKIRAIDAVNASVTSSGFTEGTTEIRSGRIKIPNAYGSELLPLSMKATVQFYNASANWVQSSSDTVTTIVAANFALSFPVATANHLTACETALSVAGTSPNFSINLSSPGAGNNGWADLTLNLASTAAGNRCTTVGGPGAASTTANSPWLQFPAGSNPAARATFGVYKGNNNFIYQRENY